MVGLIPFGRGEQIRTADPWPPMPVRYQAAPRPDVRDSNHLQIVRQAQKCPQCPKSCLPEGHPAKIMRECRGSSPPTRNRIPRGKQKTPRHGNDCRGVNSTSQPANPVRNPSGARATPRGLVQRLSRRRFRPGLSRALAAPKGPTNHESCLMMSSNPVRMRWSAARASRRRARSSRSVRRRRAPATVYRSWYSSFLISRIMATSRFR